MLPPDLMHLPAAEMLWRRCDRRFPVLCPVLLPYQTASGLRFAGEREDATGRKLRAVRCPGVRVALISARLGSGYHCPLGRGGKGEET